MKSALAMKPALAMTPRLALILVLAIAGCESRPACVIDTDCPLHERCVSGGCVPLGQGVTDAGAPVDASTGARDAGARDGS